MIGQPDGRTTMQGTAALIDALPPAVRRYLARAVPTPGRPVRAVRITQEGEMFRSPGARPMRFTAVEDLAVTDVGYSWRARFPVAPLVAMNVHDGCEGGRGWMHGSLLGIPFLRKSGPDITSASVLRYLAELPWVPHAIGANRALGWRELGPRVVEASTVVAGTRHAVALHLDDCGDVVRAFTGARPRDGDVPRPWSGVYREYDVFHGIRIPTEAEVRWELPDGMFTYWRGRVTALDLLG
jgi:hypothetical protein